MSVSEKESASNGGRPTNRAAELYFLLVLLLGSILFIPWILESHGFLPEGISIPFILLGGLSPTFAAIIAARLVHGSLGIRMIFNAFRRRGFSKFWFLIPIVFPFIIALAAIALWILFGGTYDIVSVELMMIISFLIQSLIMNVWEEIGWRGFALPALQQRYSALFSGFIVGLFWSLWHWPHLLVVDSQMLTNYGSVFVFAGVTISSSIVYTWLYNSTKGNLIVPWLFHAVTNSVFPIFFYTGITGFIAPYLLLVYIVLTVLLIIIFRPTSLSHSTRVVFEE
ncbi:CPBP family intramembrane metalloprotease [Candidatus Thorarchaeota archaeon]|nr:MAG: CPBP family intramembrane metalloprotease [Candidatus Thorarchaeota archaeon]